MGQAERSAPSSAQRETAGSTAVTVLAGQSAVQGRSAVQSRSLGVPSDWYIDPADPQAAERYKQSTRGSLEDQATALLADHEAQELGEDLADDPADRPMELLLEPEQELIQPAWIGFPFRSDDFSEDGELGWQTDALCAQTDPEAFFPEKGGSTRDAKKVCGACNVRARCLEYALSNDERFGIWGGLSERERRRLRKRAV